MSKTVPFQTIQFSVSNDIWLDCKQIHTWYEGHFKSNACYFILTNKIRGIGDMAVKNERLAKNRMIVWFALSQNVFGSWHSEVRKKMDNPEENLYLTMDYFVVINQTYILGSKLK